MAVAAEFAVVGREDELARLQVFVEELAEGPHAAVIRGEAGIGKTVLWRAGLEAARLAGARIVMTRCAEAEMPLALGGVGDLLDGVLAEVADELAEPQRHALAVAVGLEAPSVETPDPIVLPRAFLACLRTLAGRSPVVLAIDDVQWLDPPSRRILAFAAKRLREAPVGILATQRGDAANPLELGHALGERLTDIRVGPLSVGALHHLIRTRLGVRVPRPTMARVHAASGGNPMFALEFAQVAASAGAPLPVPSSLEELVGERVAALPPEVLPLLAAVAAAERPTTSLLEAVVDDARTALDAAAAAGAVASAADGVVRFTHPLLASAAYAAVPPTARRQLHARLAAASGDPEEAARHVALSTFEPDAAAARLLDEAAARARSRGAPEAAATLVRHASRLTPPTDVSGREDRALALANYLADAGQVGDAEAVLDELLAGPISGPRRARVLLLAATVTPDLEALRRLTEEALEHVGGDRALRVRALLSLGTYPLAHGDLAACEALAREALAIAEQLDDPVLLAAALSHVPDPSLMERAAALAGGEPPLKGFLTPRIKLAQLRLSAGDLPGARELLDAELGAVRGWADEGLTGRVLTLLVELEWRNGNWDRAESHLEELVEMGGGDPYSEAVAVSQQARLAACRGRVDEARRLAHDTVSSGEGFHLPWWVAAGHHVVGFLALSLGEPATAWDSLRRVPEWERLAGRDPRYSLIAPDMVEAAVAVGDLDEAERALAALEARAREGEQPWAEPAALRCRALLLLARGESGAALAAADEAASSFAAAGFPLDEGRALLVAGEALRRLGERRRAAERLERAKQVFSDLGAPLWLARAEQELRRASPRPRSDRELTNAERRVAALVASGRTNREVAAHLFTTVGTVEVHLTRIYRKLDIRSRTELARRVAEGKVDLADE